MYSLDVNFLKDRPQYQQAEAKPKGKAIDMGSKTPLILGAIVGLLLPAAVGGLWLFLQQQNTRLQTEIADVDQKLASLGAQKQQIAQLDQQIQEVNQKTTALATVFNQIKPWSAILQDVRERIPTGVQIQSIQQTETAASPPPASSDPNAPAASAPAPAINLEISGTASSFDDVNYFLLTLQRSSFLKNDETQLVSAQLVPNPTQLKVPEKEAQQQSSAEVTYELPKVVSYKIKTSLNDVPASEILREIDRKGAVGLVTRIKTLQQITQKTPSETPSETPTQTVTE
ncbi:MULTISPECIES: PilN domain-containing protein [unclassified Coleofasciculus]|uniref:PilN domain-containing protein n=1 Tax=unclassified Coleofasciculus TaxID=2692782 RepID=UPI001882FB4A|nr:MULTISPECIES: PilN domain-containing protein [unclassified Coleofasciculus]MBE9129672.1 PilN domain-containing protein [Coleofasciculus sp. LEGE 07081]MBE9152199.1 PilN domain-containing protein [Coleofasciculus sp. LEGE 07092]